MTVTFNPASLAFGDKMVGDSETRSVTITNSGPGSASISPSASGTGYTVVGTYGGDGNAVTPPVTLAANAAVTVKVKFSPPSVGSFPGTLSAGGGEAALTGAGVAAAIDTPINEEIDAGGTPTRFQIAVPTFSTTLSMGKGIGGSTYNGFSATTTKNVYLNAGNVFWAQSSGDALLQSIDNNIVTAAKKNTIHVSAGSMSVLGKGGILIASGQGKDPVAANPADPESDPATGAFDSLSTASGVATIMATAFDAGLAVAVTALGIYRAFDSTWKGAPANKLANNVLSLFGVAGAGTAALLGACSIAATAGAPGIDLPGVTVFGQAGVLVGTPAFCSIYGTAGLVLGSLYPFIFGFDAEMLGLKSATISAIRDSTLQAMKKATVKSSKKVDIAAKDTITIGVGPQYLDNPPYKIEMTPLGGVVVSGAVNQSMTLNAQHLRLQHSAAIELEVVPYVVEMAPGSVMLANQPRNQLFLMDSMGIMINHTGSISLSGNTGQAGVALNAAGAAITGNRIQLG
ncbi:MAG: hypothetical protein IT372_42320 [Polyangiaceae bacterium]|nr:hypothetical protein [Polyangiaceae bacterium]